MKFKMSDKSLFAILLRSPSWISFAVVAVFAAASVALLPAQYVPFGMMGAFPFLAIGCITAWRQWHAPSPARLAGMQAKISAMSWREFSAALEQSYLRRGSTVVPLNSPAADFSLLKNGNTTVVSCKRWKAANHGIEALRDLIAEKDKRGADSCAYLSLGQVTDTARAFAQAQGIRLVAGEALLQLFLD